ncbi:TlpA family protein disulfide reductase [Flavilitoribacter nigricans]|uniref:Thioredoxin domain-containing protein n=1 Tax=Flavilitoribacter nigricans (strain ATCC 23147 / DSM 23189 / NBRC 102662 / NCIMB 1420 / SS-2) TaxID=1122177 RepID=A0A2D0NA73_FLAN2|nr:TlpA disulfide reductase family protein [Flavilitoribacter nigricans]PHN05276.1 hypothetical protein CRP01_17320 [Flavilitoribacter nigricans DSM 23189 = NBRC 102662]
MRIQNITNLLIAIIFLFTVSVNPLNAQAVIRGTISSMEDWSDEIYLLAITDYDQLFSATSKGIIDTVRVDADGHFVFKLDQLPCTDCLYRIDLRPRGARGPTIYNGSSRENYALFELKNGQELELSGDAEQFTRSLRIQGGPDNWQYRPIRELRQPVYEFTDSVYAFFSKPHQLSRQAMDSLRESNLRRMEQLSRANNELLADYIERSPNIYNKIVGLFHYDYDRKADNDLALYESVAGQLKRDYAAHPYYQQLLDQIYRTRYVLPVGSLAPDLKLTTPDGETIPLHQAGTNLILIDFWASWCSPCRHENRVTVKPLYEKFKEYGFMVYSVSLDDDWQNWRQAIEQDGMSWINVSDLKGQGSPVYGTYKIEALPTTYLIDKADLRIIGKNIRGEELQQFVAEYYKF